MRSVCSILTAWLLAVCVALPAFGRVRQHRVVHSRTRRHVVRRHSVTRHPVRHVAVKRRRVRYRRHAVHHAVVHHAGYRRRIVRRKTVHYRKTAVRRRTRRIIHRRIVHHSASGISPARATQIQHALIRAGYLQHSSGVWDAGTAAALRRYQQAHHWQSRVVPDARALIALGLGPRNDQTSLYPTVADTAPPVMAGSDDGQPAAGASSDFH